MNIIQKLRELYLLIDIKKQGTSTYAFIQYSDISSVVKGMRKLDGENLGANRIKLGFGKSMPTNCVWLHGISESTSDKCLFRQCSRFGTVVSLTVDRERGKCLVCYESVESASNAVTDLKGRLFNGRRLQVDFASRECQKLFFEKSYLSQWSKYPEYPDVLIPLDTSDVIKVNNKKLFSSTSGSVKSKTGIGVHGAKETSAIPLKTVDATSSMINRSLTDPRRQSSTVHHHLNSLSSSEVPTSSTPTSTVVIILRL
uniref:RRM domain-containing protein n=1 Tax=Tetranychus urticae TaxID=32264 RepID=T1JRP0_TETUR